MKTDFFFNMSGVLKMISLSCICENRKKYFTIFKNVLREIIT